jgi:hypothetical protein
VDQISNGQVLQARGGLISFQRGLTSQGLYLIHAPLKTVQEKLTTWNPATHPELQVWMHERLPAHPTTADFGALQTLPDNSSVKALIDLTAKFDPANPSLQVDEQEAQVIASMRQSGSQARALFTGAWSEILAGRVNRFLNAKLATETYGPGGGNIKPLEEIKSLLRSDVKVYQRCHALLMNTPVYAMNKVPPVTLYYESFDVEGTAALGTGAVYEDHPLKVPGGPAMGAPAPDAAAAAPVDSASIPTAPAASEFPAETTGTAAPMAPAHGPVLVADIEYYLNSGIYVSIELEQLSPVTVNGQEATVVWRDDLVSTANVAYLHGTERLASGMIMLQDVKQAVDAFRSEFH